MGAFEKAIIVLCTTALIVLSACAIYRDFGRGVTSVECRCKCHDPKPDDHKPKPKPGVGEPHDPLGNGISKKTLEEYRAFKAKYGPNAEPIANSWGTYKGVGEGLLP